MKNFITIVLVLLAFTSCTNNNLVEENNDHKTDNSSYVKLNVTINELDLNTDITFPLNKAAQVTWEHTKDSIPNTYKLYLHGSMDEDNKPQGHALLFEITENNSPSLIAQKTINGVILTNENMVNLNLGAASLIHLDNTEDVNISSGCCTVSCSQGGYMKCCGACCSDASRGCPKCCAN